MSTSERDDSMDRAAVRSQPPLYYLLTLGVGLAIHYWVWPLPLAIPTTLRITLGIFIGVSGLGIFVLAAAQQKQTGNDPNPHSPTVSIITSGPYSFSRNPIYLGVALLQAGIALWLGSVWVLASVLLALVLVNFLAIRPEETYLERKFGDAYLQYKGSVRRWI